MPPGPLKPEQVAKMLSELDIVRQNMDIMSDIMNENEPGKENAEDLQLLDVRMANSPLIQSPRRLEQGGGILPLSPTVSTTLVVQLTLSLCP